MNNKAISKQMGPVNINDKKKFINFGLSID